MEITMQNAVLARRLTTLDCVLIRQAPQEQRMYGAWEDWCYFLSYEEDGGIQVANTIGYTRIYSWDQVESIEKREPITVRALTEKNFLQYLSTDGGRRGAYTPEYAVVEVLMGRENLRGHIDGFHIRYADGKEFGSASASIIHHEGMCRLRATVNRGVMPVCTSKRGRGAEAKGEAGLDARRAKKVITQFLAAALAGKNPSTEHNLHRS